MHKALMGTMVGRNKRNTICWRGLLRLVLVGTGPYRYAVSTKMNKENALAELVRLLGQHCPDPARLTSKTELFTAFAWVMESYTGKPTTRDEAFAMFVNKSHRGYEHTERFWEKIGALHWPPALNAKLSRRPRTGKPAMQCGARDVEAVRVVQLPKLVSPCAVPAPAPVVPAPPLSPWEERHFPVCQGFLNDIVRHTPRLEPNRVTEPSLCDWDSIAHMF